MLSLEKAGLLARILYIRRKWVIYSMFSIFNYIRAIYMFIMAIS